VALWNFHCDRRKLSLARKNVFLDMDHLLLKPGSDLSEENILPRQAKVCVDRNENSIKPPVGTELSKMAYNEVDLTYRFSGTASSQPCGKFLPGWGQADIGQRKNHVELH